MATRVHVPPATAPEIGDRFVRMPLGRREQIVRGLVVFVVGVVALYGALTLLRDLAGLIAISALTVLALVALFSIFRSRFRRPSAPHEAAMVPARAR